MDSHTTTHDIATEAERATPDYWRERYNAAAAQVRRLREHDGKWEDRANEQFARAELAEARLAALESAIIDGNSGEWYGSAQHVEGRSDWPTLTALADAIIAAQAAEQGGDAQ